MEEDPQALDEVVVVGYTTQTRGDLTGAVGSVDISEAIKTPVVNAAELLQGRVTGVTVVTSGEPGSAPKVNIRGFGTSNNTNPLYIIDGVQTDDANILNNLVLKELFIDASEKVVEGKLLSNALNASKTKIDYAFIQSIALGEDTSEVENVLTNISELYFEENRDKINMLLTLLEPALMLFVGGSIGFIVAAMLLPIFSMSIG